MFGTIKKIIEKQKQTMKQSHEQCTKCEYYSYKIQYGMKLEHCRKYHKECNGDCPDWEQFDWQKPYTFTYYKGRIE